MTVEISAIHCLKLERREFWNYTETMTMHEVTDTMQVKEHLREITSI